MKYNESNNRKFGAYGEKLAQEYLIKNNYKILEINFYCRQGEIDIIAKEKGEIIFVEVKTRTNERFGRPIEAINSKKKIHMYNAAKYFLYKNYLLNMPVRFDVVEVLLRNGKIRINQVKGVI